jgi:threonine/homoserine/homoserine lactone efflux protein
MLTLFFKGIIIGFAIAAPVGPIGILCVQRSLHDGFKIGFITGLGAALADGVYGLVAGFGITSISSLLIDYRSWIQSIGGMFLLYLGMKLFLNPPSEKTIRNHSGSCGHAFTTSFFLTLTNPATILSFIAVFAGLGLGTTSQNYLDAVLLVSGILLGSALWWILLSSGVSLILRHKLSPFFMRRINQASGVIIFGFGVFSLLF